MELTFRVLGVELSQNDLTDLIATANMDNEGYMTFGGYVTMMLPVVLRVRAQNFQEHVDLEFQVILLQWV